MPRRTLGETAAERTPPAEGKKRHSLSLSFSLSLTRDDNGLLKLPPAPRRFSLESPKFEATGTSKEISTRAAALLSDREEFIRLLSGSTGEHREKSPLVGVDARRRREDWIRRRVEDGGVFGAEEAKENGLIDEVRFISSFPLCQSVC